MTGIQKYIAVDVPDTIIDYDKAGIPKPPEEYGTIDEPLQGLMNISVSGIITFKNAVELRNTIANIPLNRLMIETDAPYLAPHPFRGKKNEPSFVKYTLETLAKLKQENIETVEKQTSENFFKVFVGE